MGLLCGFCRYATAHPKDGDERGLSCRGLPDSCGDGEFGIEVAGSYLTPETLLKSPRLLVSGSPATRSSGKLQVALGAFPRWMKLLYRSDLYVASGDRTTNGIDHRCTQCWFVLCRNFALCEIG